MDIVAPEQMQWRRGADHRAGGVMFKDLFIGEPGPGNYWLTLVHVDDYEAPTHKHNFDQVRFMLDGGFGFGEQVQEEGTVGYFTAGLPYTQQSAGPNVHLLLQCEGGDAEPFMGQAELFAAVERLRKRGTFENGKFAPEESPDSPVDGYEACWEETMGRPVQYPAPRYHRPMIMDPNAFAFRPDPGAPGVGWKRLGSFTERGLELQFLRLDPGAAVTLAAETSPILLYALKGEGEATPAEGEVLPWRKGEALRLQPGEQATLKAPAEGEAAELFCLRLPA